MENDTPQGPTYICYSIQISELIKLLPSKFSNFGHKTSQIYNRVKTIQVFLLKVQILLFWLLWTTWKV